MEKKLKATISARAVNINEEFIRLAALLKFCGAVKSGGEAKEVIQNGSVTVDGEVCLMRGKKLRDGQIIGFDGNNYKVVFKGENHTA